MLHKSLASIYRRSTWHFSFSRCGFPAVALPVYRVLFPRCLSVGCPWTRCSGPVGSKSSSRCLSPRLRCSTAHSSRLTRVSVGCPRKNFKIGYAVNICFCLIFLFWICCRCVCKMCWGYLLCVCVFWHVLYVSELVFRICALEFILDEMTHWVKRAIM